MKPLYHYTDIFNILETNHAEIIGNTEIIKFSNIASISNKSEHSLDWSRKTVDIIKYIDESPAKTFVISKDAEKYLVPSPMKLYIIVENPLEIISLIAEKLFFFDDFYDNTSSYIHPNAKIGKNVKIGPNTIIDDCTIGANCKIYGNNYIYKHSVIGNNTIIFPGAIIGGKGFGFYQKNNTRKRFAQIGKVIIGDNVEIGANTCVDRGALGDTIINDGTKIDSMVHIGHNVNIGKNCVICSNTIISGSVRIGNEGWISPNCAIKEHIKIGENVFISIGSIVVENIPNNKTVAGNFAIDKDKFLKQFIKNKGLK